MAQIVILAFGRLRQEDHEFKVKPGYAQRHSNKKKEDRKVQERKNGEGRKNGLRKDGRRGRGSLRAE